MDYTLEYTEQELRTFFELEGGNNGEPVLNSDGYTEEEFEAWKVKFLQWANS